MNNHTFIESLPFGRALAILAKTYFGALTKRLEHLEIERHYSILIFIEGSTGGCTQQCICDCLKIDKVSMVGRLDYLIKKKYIKKSVNPDDRREHFIELTSKAKAVLPVIHEAIDSLNKEAFKGLSKEQQKELYRCMHLVQSNLEPLPSQKIYINYKKAKKGKA
ncbi:MAG TPA: MarR family winged helix-turn-helix transcriptional regulator [Bacteroidia bacterium]|jgi:DNA-binding MarR family transcriptional regulator